MIRKMRALFRLSAMASRGNVPRNMIPLKGNFEQSVEGISIKISPSRIQSQLDGFPFSCTCSPNAALALEFRFVFSYSLCHCEVCTLLPKKLSES